MAMITVYHVNSVHQHDRNISDLFEREFGVKTRFTRAVKTRMNQLGINVKRIEKLYPVLLR